MYKYAYYIGNMCLCSVHRLTRRFHGCTPRAAFSVFLNTREHVQIN